MAPHQIEQEILKVLAEEGTIAATEVTRAIKLYKLNPEKPNPTTV